MGRPARLWIVRVGEHKSLYSCVFVLVHARARMYVSAHATPLARRAVVVSGVVIWSRRGSQQSSRRARVVIAMHSHLVAP